MDPNQTTGVILGTFAIMGFLHTIQPDHWLPFSLVAKAQKWSYRKTVAISTLGAIADILPETILGIVIVMGWEGLGHSATHEWEEKIALINGLFLIGFGGLYMAWAIYRSDTGKAPHFHIHFHSEGHDGHAHESPNRMVEKATIGLLIFSAISPCLGTLGIFQSLVDRTWELKLAAIGTYAAVSIVVEVAFVLAALRAYNALRFRFLEKHAETLTGILIMLIGVYLLFFNGGHAGHSHAHG